MMSTRYRVKAPISAVLIEPGGQQLEGQKVPETIPVGAILVHLSRLSARFGGLAHVVWDGNEYAIFDGDLHEQTELVESA